MWLMARLRLLFMWCILSAGKSQFSLVPVDESEVFRIDTATPQNINQPTISNLHRQTPHNQQQHDVAVAKRNIRSRSTQQQSINTDVLQKLSPQQQKQLASATPEQLARLKQLTAVQLQQFMRLSPQQQHQLFLANKEKADSSAMQPPSKSSPSHHAPAIKLSPQQRQQMSKYTPQQLTKLQQLSEKEQQHFLRLNPMAQHQFLQKHSLPTQQYAGQNLQNQQLNGHLEIVPKITSIEIESPQGSRFQNMEQQQQQQQQSFNPPSIPHPSTTDFQHMQQPQEGTNLSPEVQQQRLQLLSREQQAQFKLLSPQQQQLLLRLHPQQVQQVLDHQQHIKKQPELQPIDTEPTSRRLLKAFIHVGPPKTGSTHIQRFLKEHEQTLDASGYKLILQKAYEFQDATTGSKYHQVTDFIQTSYSSGKHVIYSSEELASLQYDGLEKLRQSFRLFDVHIVIVYRELLTRVLSAYNHHARRSEAMVPLAEVLLNATTHVRFTTEAMIESFAKFFGLENIVVLDYYGMLAAGIDEAEVITCEVMGVICQAVNQASAAVGSSLKHENAASDWTSMQLLDNVLRFGETQRRCIRSTERSEQETIEAIEQLHTHLHKAQRQLPMKSVSIDAVKLRAHEISQRLHEKFGDRFLYGNESANDFARAALQDEEIDANAIVNDSFWVEWLQQASRELERKNWLRECAQDGT